MGDGFRVVVKHATVKRIQFKIHIGCHIVVHRARIPERQESEHVGKRVVVLQSCAVHIKEPVDGARPECVIFAKASPHIQRVGIVQQIWRCQSHADALKPRRNRHTLVAKLCIYFPTSSSQEESQEINKLRFTEKLFQIKKTTL